MDVDVIESSTDVTLDSIEPEVIDVNIVEPPVVTLEVLLSGGTAQIIALPSKYRFTTTSAREAYFAANPDELLAQMYILVGGDLYQYSAGQWVSMVNIITGPAGGSFTVAGELASVDDLPDPSYAPSNEAYLVAGYDDGNHLFILVDGQWSDQGALSGVRGPQGPTGATGPKGDPGETPTFRISDDGHLIAMYKSDILEVFNAD